MGKLYIVYQLLINGNIYVGATSNYNSRCRTHKAGLKRLLQAGKLQVSTVLYRNVIIDDLKKYGYELKIYCYCNDADTAATIEGRLINKYNQTRCLLNVSTKSGFVDFPAKRKKRGLTIEQAMYRAEILRRSSSQ